MEINLTLQTHMHIMYHSTLVLYNKLQTYKLYDTYTNPSSFSEKPAKEVNLDQDLVEDISGHTNYSSTYSNSK